MCGRRPIGSDRGTTAPTSPCSTSSSRRRRVAVTSSCERLWASSNAAALAVEHNRISGGTRACLFNSFNFDFARLRRFARADCRMVHRVDGPIGAYRGFDDGTDARIAAINAELADATVLQSRYSLEKHAELGIELREPVVISNTVDPSIFHPPDRREALDGRPLRVIASSWSQNPRKGADVLAWLDRNLDPRAVRAHLRGPVAAPVRANPSRPARRLPRCRSPSSRARRLPRREQGRSLLQRTARGARVRAARGVPGQRGPPGARRAAAGLSFATCRRGAGGARADRRRSRPVSRADLGSVARRRSRTAICRCSGCRP